jgi:hypothetical protein
MDTQAERLVKAVEEYEKRWLGIRKPQGDWDNAHRFFPDPEEMRACCRTIRDPSRAWPFSLWRHCFTIKHVAYLFDVDPLKLRLALKKDEQRVGRKAKPA